MAKKINIVEPKNPEMVAEIFYKIFELTDEGHFREPKREYSDGCVFDHYNGYASIEEAKKAICKEANAKKYGYKTEYIVLPIITTSEKVDS